MEIWQWPNLCIFKWHLFIGDHQSIVRNSEWAKGVKIDILHIWVSVSFDFISGLVFACSKRMKHDVIMPEVSHLEWNFSSFLRDWDAGYFRFRINQIHWIKQYMKRSVSRSYITFSIWSGSRLSRPSRLVLLGVSILKGTRSSFVSGVNVQTFYVTTLLHKIW